MDAAAVVCQFGVVVLIEEDVFQLDVSVHHIADCHVSHSLHQLFENRGYLFFTELLPLDLDCITLEVLGTDRLPLAQYCSTRYTSR